MACEITKSLYFIQSTTPYGDFHFEITRPDFISITPHNCPLLLRQQMIMTDSKKTFFFYKNFSGFAQRYIQATKCQYKNNRYIGQHSKKLRISLNMEAVAMLVICDRSVSVVCDPCNQRLVLESSSQCQA